MATVSIDVRRQIAPIDPLVRGNFVERSMVKRPVRGQERTTGR